MISTCSFNANQTVRFMVNFHCKNIKGNIWGPNQWNSIKSTPNCKPPSPPHPLVPNGYSFKFSAQLFFSKHLYAFYLPPVNCSAFLECISFFPKDFFFLSRCSKQTILILDRNENNDGGKWCSGHQKETVVYYCRWGSPLPHSALYYSLDLGTDFV